MQRGPARGLQGEPHIPAVCGRSTMYGEGWGWQRRWVIFSSSFPEI